MISNIQHILPDDMPLYNKNYHKKYKEMWYIKEGDGRHPSGAVVAAITLENEFLCYDEYRNEIVRFNRKEKIKKLQHD